MSLHDSPPPSWYEPIDMIEVDDPEPDLPADVLTVDASGCGWWSALTTVDDD